MNKRRNFLKNILFGVGALVLPVEVPSVLAVEPVVRPPVKVIYSLNEWMTLEIQREIDQEMIRRMMACAYPQSTELVTLPTLEEEGYILSPNFTCR